MYIQQLITPQSRMHTLLTELRISPEENVDFHGAVCLGNRLEITHFGYKNKISIFEDFQIIQIYGEEPSIFDQRKYRNIMSKLFEKEGYAEEAKKHPLRSKKKTTQSVEPTKIDDEENESE